MPTGLPMCQVYLLGRVAYVSALAIQRQLAAQRSQQEIPDTLLLLEHPHTYTLGSSASLDNLLMTETERTRRGVSIFEADRGGDITYHGPGQLVGYPIIQLDTNESTQRADVVAYVRNLESVLIQALESFGISGERLHGFSGVWVRYQGELAKIAAIGVKVTAQRVSYHGFALNVNTDMSFFNGIIPCGIRNKPVLSMEQFLGKAANIEAVQKAVINAFGTVFSRQPLLESSLNVI